MHPVRRRRRRRQSSRPPPPVTACHRTRSSAPTAAQGRTMAFPTLGSSGRTRSPAGPRPVDRSAALRGSERVQASRCAAWRRRCARALETAELTSRLTMSIWSMPHQANARAYQRSHAQSTRGRRLTRSCSTSPDPRQHGGRLDPDGAHTTPSAQGRIEPGRRHHCADRLRRRASPGGTNGHAAGATATTPIATAEASNCRPTDLSPSSNSSHRQREPSSRPITTRRT